ncbi:Complement decay-accelerating factor [Varanus komodoensis]|nr:Complement decay-accelerating factor [Varanus komodoensis]
MVKELGSAVQHLTRVPFFFLLLFLVLPGGSCGPPVRLDFAELHSAYKEKNSFPIGSVVKYTCRPGYVKHPGMKASLTCLRNQVWSEVQEFCKRKSCGHPGEPDNGRLIVSGDFLFGSTVNYTWKVCWQIPTSNAAFKVTLLLMEKVSKLVKYIQLLQHKGNFYEV